MKFLVFIVINETHKNTHDFRRRLFVSWETRRGKKLWLTGGGRLKMFLSFKAGALSDIGVGDRSEWP